MKTGLVRFIPYNHILHKENFTQGKLLLLVYYNIKSQYVVQ